MPLLLASTGPPVWDATTETGVGAIKRKGLKSIFKDEWIILDKAGHEIGKLTESSTIGALMSRLIKLIPQTYKIMTLDNRNVALLRQSANPFVLKYKMSIDEPDPPIDRRLIISIGILLAAIEGRQK